MLEMKQFMQHRAILEKATLKMNRYGLFKDDLATYQQLRIISDIHFAIGLTTQATKPSLYKTKFLLNLSKRGSV